MLANLIKQHATTEANAGDWAAVAKILNELTVVNKIGKVGGKASLSALIANGIDPNIVIAAMRSVPMSSELLDTLTVSGVDWADDLTAYVMQGLVAAGKITQQTATVMRGLSEQTVSVVTTTAEDCESAWIHDRIQLAWANAMNESINAALASGDRQSLKAALAAAIEVL